MYKRIAGIETLEEYRDLQEELVDRFGEIPIAAENLLRVALLKADAHAERHGRSHDERPLWADDSR